VGDVDYCDFDDVGVRVLYDEVDCDLFVEVVCLVV